MNPEMVKLGNTFEYLRYCSHVRGWQQRILTQYLKIFFKITKIVVDYFISGLIFASWLTQRTLSCRLQHLGGLLGDHCDPWAVGLMVDVSVRRPVRDDDQPVFLRPQSSLLLRSSGNSNKLRLNGQSLDRGYSNEWHTMVSSYYWDFLYYWIC